MNCSEARKLIPLFSGDDLEAEEVGALESHLASCPRCREFLEACRADRDAVASLREQGPGPLGAEEFWAGVKAKLEPDIRKRRAHVVLHRTLRAVTAAAVLLIALTFLVRLAPEGPAPPPVRNVESVGTLREPVGLETDERSLEMEECELCIDTNRKFDF
jgi:anti-sigma factor RsiW